MSSAGANEELAELDHLLTRVALTEDTKLERVLARLLPAVIPRLASPHEASRAKLLEMLGHINKRLRELPTMLLPLHALVGLYFGQASLGSPMVLNFAMVYLEMAFERASVDERLMVAPKLLDNIALRHEQHQGILLRCAALGLEVYGKARRVDKETGDLDRFNFVKSKEDTEVWLLFCTQTLLYMPPPAEAQGREAMIPGLSPQQVQRVVGNAKQAARLRGETLALRKLGLLNLTVALDVRGEDVYPLYLVATADSHELVAQHGEELLKRRGGSVSLEDAALMARLLSLYQGSAAHGEQASVRVAPAGLVLRARLLGCFTHSVAAANAFPATLQIIFGAVFGGDSTLRMKQAGMEFAVWTFKHAREEHLKPVAATVLVALLKLLESPALQDPSAGRQQVRAFVYQAIGQLAQRTPAVFGATPVMAQRLFGALGSEASAPRTALQEAILAMGPAYKGAAPKVAEEVEAMLVQHMGSEEDAVRFCCVHWASTLFSRNRPALRYLCIMGAGDKKLEIREIAERSLFPVPSTTAVGLEKAAEVEDLPGVGPMVDEIVQQRPQAGQRAGRGEQALLFPVKMYEAMLRFLQRCWQRSGRASTAAQRAKYRAILERAMARDGSWALHALASRSLLELAASQAAETGAEYSQRVAWLRGHVGHADAAVRESMARLLGIVAESLPPAEAATLVQELLSLLDVNSKSRVEEKLGALSGLGYVLAQAATGVPQVAADVQAGVLKELCRVLKDDVERLGGVAAEAVGHIGMRRPLPLPPGNLVDQASSGSGDLTRAAVLHLLSGVLKNRDEKTVQQGTLALGHLSMGDRDMVMPAAEAIFTLSKNKTQDVLFAAGEALALMWGGVEGISPDLFLRTPLRSLTEESNFLAEVRREDVGWEATSMNPEPSAPLAAAMESIQRRLLEVLMVSGHGDERCAGTVWLLSLMSYAGRGPALQALLPSIQEAFSLVLGDSNELTQEMASRGMSVVYDLGGPAMRQQLVTELVATLSGNTSRKHAVKLVWDSEVLAGQPLSTTATAGTSGSTGNEGMSTYRELCSLASDMGQPDMIYRFMDLANYHAGLNSRRGTAFGLARIAAQAGEALQPHMGALLPRLLRYQYDPSRAIQEAMTHIWRALVPEPKKTIDSHWEAIMEDLLLQAGSRLWRSREAACLALADLLSGRRFQEVWPFLQRLWTMAFRLVDDIKESVRTAGDKLLRSVSSLSVRLCDAALTPSAEAQKACALVLPVLLEKGIMSSLKGVRKTALDTTSKLVRVAGPAVRPLIPEVVAAMLEALSSLEDQALNYIELHVERKGLTADHLESARLSLARASPMWATLDLCMRQVDAATLEVLVGRLTALLRSGVGLNTRVGTAHFTGSLAQVVGAAQLKPHAATLLKALYPALLQERSGAVRAALASAAGSVARYGGDARVQSLGEDAAALYFNPGDTSARLCSALLLRDLTRNASTSLRSHVPRLLPLAFMARFDEDNTVKALFEEVWEDASGSATAAVQLYQSEISILICEGLASSSWTRRRQGAETAGALCETLGANADPLFLQAVLAALLDELPGRLWEGKEEVPKQVANLCKMCPQALGSAAEAKTTPEAVVGALLASCERRKRAYSTAALKALQGVLETCKGLDLFRVAGPPLLGLCQGSRHAASGKVNSEEEDGGGKLPLDLLLGCLSAAWETAAPGTMEAYAASMAAAVAVALSNEQPWAVRAAAAAAGKVLLCSLQEHSGSEQLAVQIGMKSAEVLVEPLLMCTQDMKHSELRKVALEALQQASQLLKGISVPALRIRTGLQELLLVEKSFILKSVAENILDQLDTLSAR